MPIPSIIAIDGPAASGKSTLGKRLADALGYLFFDTGVMYRAITYLVIKKGIPVEDEGAVTRLSENAQIEVRPPSIQDQRSSDILVDGEDVTWQIRQSEVEDFVSPVSAYPGVRKALSAKQRRIGQRGKVVMVGRDIGTVVLPEADLKIYLKASAEVRAQRRYSEIIARGEQADYQEILAAMRKRDEIDSTRAVAPLRPAEDAIVLDSDKLDQEETFQAALKLVEQQKKSGTYKPPLHNRLLRPLGRPIFRLIFHILARIRLYGKENIPQKGAYLVAINHVSLYDPPFVLAFWPVELEAVGAIEIWSKPGQSLLVRMYGGIPVHRGQYDRRLIETTLNALNSGYPLVIAPEGGRSHKPGLHRAAPGIAYLHEMAGVPIVPVGMTGTTDDFFDRAIRGERPTLEMRIGKPFNLPPITEKGEARRNARQHNADLVMLRLAALLPADYRGVYSDGFKYETATYMDSEEQRDD